MKERMDWLEAADARDRDNGTDRMERLRQVPPETGKFIALMALSAPEGEYIEVGTSAGYSTLWLSLAARHKGVKIKTHELLEAKIKLARETFSQAGISDVVELIEGDALLNLKKLDHIAFCFLDCEKEMYLPCWDIIAPKMVPGGILVADNAINHRETLQPMLDQALRDPRFDSMIVTQGKGELLCRRK